MNDDHLTGPQTLLVAAAGLDEPFHESDLILAAWDRSHRLFGLRGHEDFHPSDNRVRAALCHTRGPVDSGYLDRVAPLTYRLTPAGRAEAKAIANGDRNGQPVKRCRLPADIEEELGRMLGSRAWRNWLMSRPICFRDAVNFWGAEGHGLNGYVEAALEVVTECLRDCSDYALTDGLHFKDGRVVGDVELDRLRACDRSMREGFKKELARKGK